MRIASTTTGTHSLTHDGVTYEPDDDGLFEVPEHVGDELVGFTGWLPEHEAAELAAAEQAERDNDAGAQAQRIADLEARVDALEALLDSEDDADNADGDGDGEPEQGTPARSRSRNRKPTEPAAE